MDAVRTDEGLLVGLLHNRCRGRVLLSLPPHRLYPPRLSPGLSLSSSFLLVFLGDSMVPGPLFHYRNRENRGTGGWVAPVGLPVKNTK